MPLTPVKFGLLEYLLDHGGQAVSRASLVHDVWGQSYAAGSNVIEAEVPTEKKEARGARLMRGDGLGRRLQISRWVT